MKVTINEEWENYILKQLERGVPKDKLKEILIREKYSSDIINKLLYNNLNQKKNDIYQNYINKKISALKLSDTESNLLNFFKTQSFLKDKIEKERMVVIDNWLDESLCNYISNIFKNSNYKEVKTSNKNKLNFTFNNIIQTPEIKRFLFMFNNLIPDNYLFNGSIGMSKYSKGSYIDEHTDHGGYIINNEKYYRNISAVIYFNKEWIEDYGGCFVDIENNKKILPIFNRAVFFHVPYKHKVEPIIVDKDRYGIFMFFSVKKKRYNLCEKRFRHTSSLI